MEGTVTVRRAAVAGLFYPPGAQVLTREVEGYLRTASLSEHELCRRRPKALIVPHAGYVYSGPVAANAYTLLADLRPAFERVVLLGPAHRVYLQGLAASSAAFFETPLGRVPVDRDGVAAALELAQVGILDAAHASEHCLEVHLPFLQVVLGEFSIVPLVVGEAAPDEVAEVIERLWGGPETLILVSSDLSHYHDYATARRLDADTTRRIETLDADALDEGAACGRNAIRGLLVSARRHDLRVHTLDVRNSGDTAGGADRVVGYGSYAFC
jgi:AmmeMemoRadiSam system protein B